ncbi:MAG: hypothetical protein ACD_73C00330G0001 [uncultured bacterium]|nr:MAG: hypothetical protein ACD_73C00330G0001 [uncultured bacterium]
MFYLLILLLVLTPSLAEAWGGITHLEYAHGALSCLAAFPPMVKKLLQKYKAHFLYGSVAADITLGKDLRGYIYNCHNWRVAFDIFDNKAKTDAQKTFMLGYLSHLAADTVSHNYFVPYTMVYSWGRRFFQHVYWEMRMDLSVPENYWQMLQGFLKEDFSDDDSLLEGHLKRTFFSFSTNKKIFNGLLVLQQLKKYKEMVSHVDQKSEWALTQADIKHYKSLAQKAVIDFLTRVDQSFCMDADPTGKLKMLYARDLVSQLKGLAKDKQLNKESEAKAMKLIKKSFEESIYRASFLPDIHEIMEIQAKSYDS